MIYHLFIKGEKVHSFSTFCQALAFCQYHQVERAIVKMGTIIIATIQDGETV